MWGFCPEMWAQVHHGFASPSHNRIGNPHLGSQKKLAIKNQQNYFVQKRAGMIQILILC
jgi:hypothetical protein